MATFLHFEFLPLNHLRDHLVPISRKSWFWKFITYQILWDSILINWRNSDQVNVFKSFLESIHYDVTILKSYPTWRSTPCFRPSEFFFGRITLNDERRNRVYKQNLLFMAKLINLFTVGKKWCRKTVLWQLIPCPSISSFP